MENINRESPISLYYQVKQSLLMRIQQQEWGDGDMRQIPSEGQLCGEYGVSRVTVRRALAELENEGFIKKKVGVGTFVAASKLEMYLDAVSGFAQQMARQGYLPSTKVIECKPIKGDGHV